MQKQQLASFGLGWREIDGEEDQGINVEPVHFSLNRNFAEQFLGDDPSRKNHSFPSLLSEGITSSSNANPWSVQDAFVEGSHLWALLVTGYSFVFLVGVIGNVALLAALCGSGTRARALPVRNHLMVNLAIADLFVTAICVPISACAAASHACWPSFVVSWMCQLGPLLQRTPVAASTLSLALLSLDRWAALRHPRFAQRFREKRFVAVSMISIWILAGVVAAPTFWARHWDEGSVNHFYETDTTTDSGQIEHPLNTNSTVSGWDHWKWRGACVERWTNIALELAYTATYLGTAFVSPAIVVAACHASVSQKLTAQLQTLAGTATDRTRQRPKHVIIVARDPNNVLIENPSTKPSRKVVPCDPNSDEDDIYLRLQIQDDLESFRQISQQLHVTNSGGNNLGSQRSSGLLKPYPALRANTSLGKPRNLDVGHVSGTRSVNPSPKPLLAARRETSIKRAHRRLRKKLLSKEKVIVKQPPPLLPTYSSQSFRSRRRAANLMAALAAVFVLCWAPYVVCALWDMFASEKSVVRLLIPFSLLLGHAHSAVNPVVSWRLNRSAFVRFQRQPILSFFPDWSPFRWCHLACHSFASCRYYCCSCEKRSNPSRQRSGNPRNNDNHEASEGCLEGLCHCWSLGSSRRRSSSPDGWNRNTSTNEAALGAFHPKYLNRLPVPDQVSKCHTSHFLK